MAAVAQALETSNVTSIKSLAESPALSSVPSAYAFNINPNDEADPNDPEFAIPIVDMSLLTSGSSDQRAQIVRDLVKICEEWGFFIAINHGVPESLMKGMIDACHGFFSLPDEEKKEFKSGNDVLEMFKYGTSYNLALDKVLLWRDFFKVRTHPEFYSLYKPAGFSDVSLEFGKRTREVALEITKAISESLGLEPNYIYETMNMDRGLQLLAGNYYPPCPQPEHAIGIPHHTDHGLVTLLIQNEMNGLHDNSESLWETFNYPIHTVLPGQEIKKGGKLSSQQSETNFSKGRFELRMQEDGNLVLVTINLPTEFANAPYYASDTTGESNSSTAGTKLEFNSSGYMYVLRENGEKLSIKEAETVSARSFYLRATLNFDGVFAQYSHPKNFTGNESWSVVWSVPDNICTMTIDSGLGVCGYNSICTLQGQRPTCACPKGYSLLDPNDPYGNCKPDFIQGCEEDKQSPTNDIYEVQMLNNTDWPLSDFMQLNPSTPESCNQSCFEDCLCAVAIYRVETCWKKKLPLSNGRVDSGLNSQAFIKVRKGNLTLPVPQPPNPDDKKRKNQTTLIRVGSALLGTSIFANLMLSAIVCLGFFFSYQKKHVSPNQKVLDSNLRSFSYEELKEATNGFNEELGKGAFGVVYKGILQIGSGVPVAVKKLNFVVLDSEKEFKTELNIIGQTHHKNLVRLVGYCDEGQERLLVYEFLSKGTLANFLFADTKPSWKHRIDIAYGVAKGLLYLHEECSTQIIHCDIKPQNILLDDYYNARIADFGVAKLLMMNQSQTQTAIRGTKGYVAPEWFRNLPITTKVDVYSFGVVLLEAICCRRSVDMENVSEERAILTDWVYDCYLEGDLVAIVDNEMEALHEKTKLERFVMVALWCIQEDLSLRPTMRKVVQMLEGAVEVHVPPCPSPYSRAG